MCLLQEYTQYCLLHTHHIGHISLGQSHLCCIQYPCWKKKLSNDHNLVLKKLLEKSGVGHGSTIKRAVLRHQNEMGPWANFSLNLVKTHNLLWPKAQIAYEILAHFFTLCKKDITKFKSGPEKIQGPLFFNTRGQVTLSIFWLILTLSCASICLMHSIHWRIQGGTRTPWFQGKNSQISLFLANHSVISLFRTPQTGPAPR